MWRTNPLEHKVAYPKETAKLLKDITNQPISLSEINQRSNGSLMADQLMRLGLVKRELIPIDGIDYIFLAGIDSNVTFKQGRRNFVRTR